MAADFDYFVILAAMRTGSNLLEANLNAVEGINCYGEAFNPHFIGRLKSDELLGVSLADRDDNPTGLLDAIRAAPGQMNGFRYFQEHDPRVLELILNDPRCAKIILTRNPLDSYLSLRIARETKQWQLKNISRRREAIVTFDPEGFADYVNLQQQFQLLIQERLQKSGQTAFYIGYDDLNQLDVLNGLATWLGVDTRLTALDDTLKPQNPAPALSKVSNPDEMQQALANQDWFNLQQTPNFEPRRGPAVARYLAAPQTPLLYLPVRGGPEAVVTQWLANLDGTQQDRLITGCNQKQVRHWMQTQPGHRKFTVLRHPLARAHTVFCNSILGSGPGAYVAIRNKLRNKFDIPIPGQIRENNYSADQHAEAFAGFLAFLRLNLAGQTPIRVDGMWCSQAQTLEGMATFTLPDLVLREEELPTALPNLARQVGHPNPPTPGATDTDTPYALAEIYDPKLEALATEVYQRDYLQFGFGNWAPL